ncbi:hypothetical protein KIN20_038192 [Parelaphostrongylus tenuis]|uniref:Uncharacterized protein n=1 Tax=Parelaphostrongylus tenuis TaxID=148309 RepID=A0AAD5WMD7_PARTN|nr:hypothetical protein KIN20_038192 [Parelaphostrongylus tenuis]
MLMCPQEKGLHQCATVSPFGDSAAAALVFQSKELLRSKVAMSSEVLCNADTVVDSIQHCEYSRCGHHSSKPL